MQSVIQEDCVWFLDGRLPEEEQKMQAMCLECAKKHDFGWYWNGASVGYGDYDLNCCFCDCTLHQREKENANENKKT